MWSEMSERMSSDERGVMIVGGPGCGKTALSLQLVQNSCFGLSGGGVRREEDSVHQVSSQLVAYHFCQLDNAVTCRVSDWIHSTAAQLSQSPLMTAYHQLLSTDHDLRSKLSMSSCHSNPASALLEGIIQPLNNLKTVGKISADCCIILLDAVEDSHTHRPDYGDNIISFLRNHLDQFPSWLKLLITVRSEKQELVNDLGLSQISLDQWRIDKRIESDISEYVSKRIIKSQSIQKNITPQSVRQASDENPQTKFQNYLVSIAKGCFLFVKMVLDLVERGHLVIKSSSFNILPKSLSEVFMLEFNLRFPSSSSYLKVSDLLSVCLASLHPLTLSDLYHTVSCLYVDLVDSWPEFLSTFKSLSGYLVTRRDESVMMFHPTFRDWLIRRGEAENRRFMCDPRVGHAAIALRMSRQESPVNDQLTLEMCHHILKAHLYRNSSSSVMSRDLQSSWISLSSDDVSLALAHLTNLFTPNINVSRLLLLSGASPDVNTDLSSNSPIICVYAGLGYTHMISLLLQFGADINIQDSSGRSALSWAASRGHMETVRLLVEAGAKLNLVDKTGECALVVAAKNGHFPVLEYLVSSDWPVTLTNQELTLSEACQQCVVSGAYHGHCEIVEFMLDMAEVEVDRVDTLMMETALCAAAANNQKHCCEVLIKRGASVSASNMKTASPLHLAAREGHFSICELLLSRGASLEAEDSAGRTCLMEASMSGHLGVVELLVTRGASLDKSDQDNLTSLSLSCVKGRVEIVKSLLSRGADLNHVDGQGRSCLDLAALNGDVATVELLLDQGAMMEHVDIHGKRPLDHAIITGSVDTVKSFLKRGAKLGPSTWKLSENKPLILLTLLNKLLEDGNTLYKRNKLSEAVQRYEYAVKRVPHLAGGQHKKVFDQLRVHLLLNMARCRRKMMDMEESIRLINQVLQIQPHCYQALHARAKVHHAAGDLHLAVADLTDAVRLAPDNRELHKILINTKQELVTKNQLMMSDNKSDKSHDSSSGVSSTAENISTN